jgi:site-specific recombinase XerD
MPPDLPKTAPPAALAPQGAPIPPSDSLAVPLGGPPAARVNLPALYLSTLQSKRSRGTQLESFDRIVRVLEAPSIDAVPWESLDFQHFQLIKQRLAARYSPSSANLTLTALRQVMKIGFLQGVVTQKQLTAVGLLGAVRGSRLPKGRALERGELYQLWKAALAWPQPLKQGLFRGFLAVFLGAGLRRDEVCGLTLDSYSPGPEGGELRVLGKGNKERAIPLDTATAAHLDAWKAAAKAIEPHRIAHRGLFFSPRNLSPLQVKTLWFLMRELGAAAGVAFSPHDLRRTYASTLLERGLDLREVQRLLGHESIATTEKYDKRGAKALAARRRAVRVWDEPEPASEPHDPSEKASK